MRHARELREAGRIRRTIERRVIEASFGAATRITGLRASTEVLFNLCSISGV